MKAGRLPLRLSACLALVGLLVGLLGVPPAAAVGAPTIGSFNPACGPEGTSVDINGNNFQGTTGVDFDGTSATFSVKSMHLITATVPTGASTGKIGVDTDHGSTTSRDDFTVSSSCAPTITSFSPSSGPVGTVVTIKGSGFVGASSVKFNGTSAATFSWNPTGTQLTATVPSGATTGKISVTRGGATATSATDFTVTGPPTPTITSFSPTSGPVGTSVTINGTGLAGATSVKFGGVAATSFSVNGAGTRVTAKVPTGAVTGKITVTTPGGTATSASDFTVTTAPTITSFTPASGPVGTVVTINGTAFTGATSVKFGGVTATSFSVDSATKITATVPAGAETGKISVTTPSGTGTSSSSFTVESIFHDRSISIALRRHLVVKGVVTAAGGFAACASDVPVRVQRRVEGVWRTIARTLTGDLGGYRVRVPDRSGRYRSVAPRVERAGDVCRRAVSRVAING